MNWKTLFYGGLLPALRRLGPARADRVLSMLGRLAGVGSERSRDRLTNLERAKSSMGADAWNVADVSRALSANVPRFLARDYPLEGLSDDAFRARFDVRGNENLRDALALGRGVVLLGSHLGAYLAAVHWLYRQEVPLRLLVQRPRHVSRALHAWLDRESDDDKLPQSAFFLRRKLPAAEAAQRMLRALSALRQGLAVYLSGDIPWCSNNARPGRLLGCDRTFLAVWADLAVLSRAPVVPVFCTHQPGGRYELTFDAPWELEPGEEAHAVQRYLARLETAIVAHPADAVAHLTWPCYTQPSPAYRPRPVALAGHS